MPTLMQKIRLALHGWSRRRAEAEKEFVARNARWGAAAAIVPAAAARAGRGVDMEGLTVAYLDDSGRIAYFLDMESGEVVDVRDGAALSEPRYRRVPARSTQSEADDRRAFVASLEPSRPRDALARSITSVDEFRRALAADRALERAWFSFKNDRAIAAIEQWLRTL